MNIWETLFLFFAFQAFLMAFFFLVRKKGDKIANYLFACYLILFGYNIFYNVLYWSQQLFSSTYIHVIATNLIPWSLYGPVLYLYIRRLVKKISFKPGDILHIIPSAYFIVNHSAFYFLSTKEKWQILKFGNIEDHVLLKNTYDIHVIIASMVFYFLLILTTLRTEISSTNSRRWLNWVAYSFLGYVVSFTSYFVLVHFGIIDIKFDYFIGFAMIFFIASVTYFGFMQPNIFDGMPIEKIIPFSKYQKTGLDIKHSKILKEKLLRVMELQKPYLNSELRLADLACELDIPKHHTSQIINENFDMNFFDFINKYRVEEWKQIIRQDGSQNITEALYASGFNNRVSFYKAFKKSTGLTPKEYRTKYHL